MLFQKIVFIVFGLLCPVLLAAEKGGVVEKYVPVGEYLFSNPDKLPDADGELLVSFSKPLSPGSVVIAYGRKNRKDRKSREQTTEEERELLKPRLAKLNAERTEAHFVKLPPDFYDLVIIDPVTMMLDEGIALHKIGSDENLPENIQKQFLEEIRRTLGLREDRIGGWEGFFDHKQIERIEVKDEKAGVLMQQMRLGVALAESGDRLEGTIHSIDVVWVERAKVAEAGWQLINRQQLYREELHAKTFFKHQFRKELQGVRIGTRKRTLNIDR
jgi:hypothetical protein